MSQPSVESDDISTINPHLATRLDALIQNGSGARIEIENAVRPLMDDLSEVRGLLTFEIDRVSLAIERAEWSSRADVAALRLRLDHLRSLRERAQADGILHFRASLEAYISALQSLRAS